MPTAIALLCALLVIIVLYELTPVSSSVRQQQFGTIRGTVSADDPTAGRALPFWRVALLPLNPLIEKILPARWRDQVRHKLYWANFAGSWLGWNEVEFWGLSLAVGAAAFVLLIRTPFVALGGALIGALMPYTLLRNTTRQIERALARELPDALYLLASMVSVGIVLPEALRRLADYAATSAQRGVFAAWVRLVLAKAHGGDLLARLRAEAELTAQPRLVALATKLELIERQGAAGSADLLRALADDQARDYRQDAELRAKSISGELTFPILICFFFPYLFVVAAPLFANIFQLLAVPR